MPRNNEHPAHRRGLTLFPTSALDSINQNKIKGGTALEKELPRSEERKLQNLLS